MRAIFRSEATTAETPATSTEDGSSRRAALTHVTVLELAFRAVLVDPTGLNESELQAKARLRKALLDAAVDQFVGCSEGLARTDARNGALRLRTTRTGTSNGATRWLVAHVDVKGFETVVAAHADEREAVRALIVAAALCAPK